MPTTSQSLLYTTLKSDTPSDGSRNLPPPTQARRSAPYQSPRRIDIRFPKNYLDQRYGGVRQAAGGGYVDISDLLKYYRLRRPEQWPPVDRPTGSRPKPGDDRSSRKNIEEKRSNGAYPPYSSASPPPPLHARFERSLSDPNLADLWARSELSAVRFDERVLGHGVSDPNISEILGDEILGAPEREYGEKNGEGYVHVTTSTPSRRHRQHAQGRTEGHEWSPSDSADLETFDTARYGESPRVNGFPKSGKVGGGKFPINQKSSAVSRNSGTIPKVTHKAGLTHLPNVNNAYQRQNGRNIAHDV